jgi:sugar lactone lactonase YvrE
MGTYGSLVEPASLLVNSLGDIFIVDRATNVIYKLSAELEPVAREGGLGGFGGGFNRPLGMASDAALNLYIADAGNRQIMIFDRNLRFVRSVGSYEDDNGEAVDFLFPSDIGVDFEGNFWVADEDRVLKLDPFFRLIFEASRKAAGYFILGRVSAVEISRNGIVAIGDIGNNRIITMSIFGNYIGTNEASAVGALSWDDHGNLWVVEIDRGRITCYDASGTLLYAFANEGGARPVSMATDRSGRLLALDRDQRRLRIYEVIRGAGGPGNK